MRPSPIKSFATVCVWAMLVRSSFSLPLSQKCVSNVHGCHAGDCSLWETPP